MRTFEQLSPRLRAAIRDYGMALGTAYQLFDDCLDLFGSEDAVGKSLGTDLACGKLTLPILILLEQASDSDTARLRSLIENWSPKNFPEIFELLARHNALTQSQTIINQEIERAQESVAGVSQSENAQALVALGDYLAQQTDALGVSTGSHGHYDANSRP